MRTAEQRYIDDLVILCDTREREPWIAFNHSTRSETIPVGDYSIADRNDQSFKPGACNKSLAVSIERKRLDDLVTCLSHERERFERELAKGRELGYFALVVESRLEDIAWGFYRSRMKPKSVVHSLTTFSVRYRLPIFFADNAKYAARLGESLLVKWVRELIKTGKIEVRESA
jgi:DNA excision repair protein ERCC-4